MFRIIIPLRSSFVVTTTIFTNSWTSYFRSELGTFTDTKILTFLTVHRLLAPGVPPKAAPDKDTMVCILQIFQVTSQHLVKTRPETIACFIFAHVRTHAHTHTNTHTHTRTHTHTHTPHTHTRRF